MKTTLSTALLLIGLALPAKGADLVTVEVLSGRKFTAEVDARTDSAGLWLRWQAGSASIVRPIAWQSVVKARVAGHDLSGDELLEIVKRIQPEATETPSSPDATRRIVLKGRADATDNDPVLAAGSTAAAESSRVGSLTIESDLGRWDANVDSDGLVLHVYPVNNRGAVVAARGTLEVELIGEIIRRGGGPEEPFCRLGHWTVAVRESDFGPDGAVYRLPFQAVRPELDLTVAAKGAVHARLSVPGQGTFEATASVMRIRPQSAVRDQLRLTTGRRFFADELILQH